MDKTWQPIEGKEAFVLFLPNGEHLVVCKGEELDNEAATLMHSLAAICYPEEWFSMEIPYQHWPTAGEAQEASLEAYCGSRVKGRFQGGAINRYFKLGTS